MPEHIHQQVVFFVEDTTDKLKIRINDWIADSETDLAPIKIVCTSFQIIETSKGREYHAMVTFTS